MIDSGLLNPPLPSGLAKRSQHFPSFANNKYLQMLLEAITHDICTIEWEKIQPSIDNLTQGKKITLQELKSLPDCIIKPSDKGGNVVLWQEKQYLEEVFRQLNDPSCYESWNNNPFPNLVREINNHLTRAHEVGLLTNKEFLFLKVEDFNIPTFYITPK